MDWILLEDGTWQYNGQPYKLVVFQVGNDGWSFRGYEFNRLGLDWLPIFVGPSDPRSLCGSYGHAIHLCEAALAQYRLEKDRPKRQRLTRHEIEALERRITRHVPRF